MCPVCLATAALIAGKATSAGGLAAIALQKIHKASTARKVLEQNKSKENPNGQ